MCEVVTARARPITPLDDLGRARHRCAGVGHALGLAGNRSRPTTIRRGVRAIGVPAKLVTPAEFEGGGEAAELHVLPADRRDRIESSGPPRLARADTRGRVKAWLEAKNSSFRGSRSALKAVWVAATSTSGPGRTVDGAVFAIRTRRRSNRSVVVGPWDWVRGRCTRCSIRLVETGPAR